MGRFGKIARLPGAIREEVNRRLEKGDNQQKMADWLNSLPEAQEVLAREFGGRSIRQQNLTEWKACGYRYWALERKVREQARQLAKEAPEVAAAADGQMTDHLATVLAAQYAAVLADWDGIDVTQESRRKQKALHGLCHDIVGLRRGDHGVMRWKTQQERKKLRDQNQAARTNPMSSPSETLSETTCRDQNKAALATPMAAQPTAEAPLASAGRSAPSCQTTAPFACRAKASGLPNLQPATCSLRRSGAKAGNLQPVRLTGYYRVLPANFFQSFLEADKKAAFAAEGCKLAASPNPEGGGKAEG